MTASAVEYLVEVVLPALSTRDQCGLETLNQHYGLNPMPVILYKTEHVPSLHERGIFRIDLIYTVSQR